MVVSLWETEPSDGKKRVSSSSFSNIRLDGLLITISGHQQTVRPPGRGVMAARLFTATIICGLMFTTVTSVTGCGGNLTAPSGGPVTSPNYPGNYGNNENCEWSITVPEGSIIRLTFDSFHTEEDYDFLTIYDGASDNAAEIENTSSTMFLKFTSDWNRRYQGFQFNYTNRAICDPMSRFEFMLAQRGFTVLAVYRLLMFISPGVLRNSQGVLPTPSPQGGGGGQKIHTSLDLVSCSRETRSLREKGSTVGQCWDPGVPANGNRDNNSNFTSGQTVRYTCMDGYQLRGTANITCQPNGTWSGATPTCEEERSPRDTYRYNV
ncbi:hypothetical protein Bbelb_254840 [Branchiostoma belcheri]|nr:hypothetical protein Bbelb_254840 [Branchiostoma belcheri]